MPKIPLLTTMLFAALCASAQQTAQYDEVQKEKIHQEIGIDYSVPDYSVRRPDAQVMGWRLTKILESLERNYTQNIYSWYLTNILNHQTDEHAPLYLPIDKLKILNIQKQGNTVSIRIKLLSKTKELGKIEREIVLSFINGVSEDDTVNTLFYELDRHIMIEN